MLSSKELKLQQKTAAQQQQVISELHALARDIERCEKTISSLKAELEAVNSKYQAPRTTGDDIAYLTDLLVCAKKKLAWEKQLASLQKRTPGLLQRMTALMHHPAAPPSEEARSQILNSLQAVQAAMERLNEAKVT